MASANVWRYSRPFEAARRAARRTASSLGACEVEPFAARRNATQRDAERRRAALRNVCGLSASTPRWPSGAVAQPGCAPALPAGGPARGNRAGLARPRHAASACTLATRGGGSCGDGYAVAAVGGAAACLSR
eukprot:scaffold4437_cov391-Prasinococcus_capsulatus_cf.AAC.10